MIVVYVSGALSAPNHPQMCKNARRLARVGEELVEAGFAVIVPG